MTQNKLQIVYYPDDRLRKIAVEVDPKKMSSVLNYMDEMLQLLYKHNGIGLAATQVGLLLRFFIIDLGLYVPPEEGVSDTAHLFINPKIVETSTTKSLSEEGCLSIPDIYHTISRFSWVVLEYYDRNLKKQSTKFHSLAAFCVQHEMDHLDGKLFIDYLSDEERKYCIKKFGVESKK